MKREEVEEKEKDPFLRRVILFTEEIWDLFICETEYG